MRGITSKSRFEPAMVDALPESATMIRPYTFAKLALIDNPDLASTDEKFIKNLATIQVHVHRVSCLDRPFSNCTTSSSATAPAAPQPAAGPSTSNGNKRETTTPLQADKL
ncbi:hypothetical protein JCM1841_002503 [Sporobolomyces salmonicolor]